MQLEQYLHTKSFRQPGKSSIRRRHHPSATAFAVEAEKIPVERVESVAQELWELAKIYCA